MALGLVIIKRNADEMLPGWSAFSSPVPACSCFAAGVYHDGHRTAPIPVVLTLLGAAITGFAVRTGRVYGSFTSRRVHIVS